MFLFQFLSQAVHYWTVTQTGKNIKRQLLLLFNNKINDNTHCTMIHATYMLQCTMPCQATLKREKEKSKLSVLFFKNYLFIIDFWFWKYCIKIVPSWLSFWGTPLNFTLETSASFTSPSPVVTVANVYVPRAKCFTCSILFIATIYE